MEESLSFGGDVLCTTDIAIANQKNHPVDGAISPDLEVNLVNQTKEKIRELIEDAIDQMKTDRKEVPVNFSWWRQHHSAQRNERGVRSNCSRKL